MRPAELLASAAAAGLDVVAITDHDTTAGWAEAVGGGPGRTAWRWCGAWRSPAPSTGSACTCSATCTTPTSPSSPPRSTRPGPAARPSAERMVELLARDYDISWADVVAHARPGASLGRPHMADALVRKGIVANRDEAFADILGSRGGYYVGHYAIDARRAIRLVRAAGGVPVMAHPLAHRRGRVVSDAVIGELAGGRAGRHRGLPPRPRRRQRPARAARSPRSSTCWSPAPATTTAPARSPGSVTTPRIPLCCNRSRPRRAAYRSCGRDRLGPAADRPGRAAGHAQAALLRLAVRLLTYVDCPRRTGSQYLDRPPPQKSPQRAHTSLGVAVHTALARWWDLAPDRRTPSAAAALVRSSWVRSGFRDDEQSERWRAKTAVQTAAYAERLDPDEQPLGIERHGGDADADAGGDRPGGPAGRPRRRAGRRRLQDLAGRADAGRGADLVAARALRRRGGRRCSAGRAPGSSCTTCRAARLPPTSTRRSRWPARFPRPSRSLRTWSASTRRSPQGRVGTTTFPAAHRPDLQLV